MPQCFLEFGQRIYPLKEGVNVIGRDAAVEVSVDSPALSRRHARIVVGAEGTTIEDLGSKNGTFVRGKRIDMPAEISDSDSLQLGSLWMVFRAPAAGEE